MQAILNVEQVRQTDNNAIENLGIPEAVLMENAAIASMDAIIQYSEIQARDVLILCGAGNNGGDGFALARLLLDYYDVDVLFIGSVDKMSKSSRTNYEVYRKLGGKIFIEEDSKIIDFHKYDVIVDAMIGVGFSGELRQNVKQILRKINETKAQKFSIDVPTGLNSDTGEYDEDSFRADWTIAMFAPKLGVYLTASDVCGEIIVSSLGLPKSYPNDFADTFALNEVDIPLLLPKRDRQSSKFDYGKVGIVAGSNRYSGAAALTSNACIKSGAGLVYLFSSVKHSALLPEVIFEQLSNNNKVNENGYIDAYNYDVLLERLSAMDSIIIGPGLGNNPDTLSLVENLIKALPTNIPVLIDADAIAIGKKVALRKNIILTPHIGELASLIGVPRQDINPFFDCKRTAKELNCNILLKGNPSIISNGERTYINTTGNPGMATAGSGDVLSGIIGGLLGQGVEPLETAALGAYLHGSSGDSFLIDGNQFSLSASNLIEGLENLIF